MSPICPSISASSSLTDAKSMSSFRSGSAQPRPHGRKRNPNGKKDQGPPVPSTSSSRAPWCAKPPPQPDRRGPNPNAGPAGFAGRGSRRGRSNARGGGGGGLRQGRAGRSGGTPRLGYLALGSTSSFVWFCFRFTEDLPRWIHIRIGCRHPSFDSPVLND